MGLLSTTLVLLLAPPQILLLLFRVDDPTMPFGFPLQINQDSTTLSFSCRVQERFSCRTGFPTQLRRATPGPRDTEGRQQGSEIWRGWGS